MESLAEAWVIANTDLPRKASQIDQMRKKMDPHSKYQEHSSHLENDSMHPATGIKNIMIHCIVEQCDGAPTFDPCSILQTAVEKDGYVSLPSTTLLSELIRTALLQMNYTSTDIMSAIGMIQIQNWKLLSFDQITDMADATIEEILSPVLGALTVRIRISSQEGEEMQWGEEHVRFAVVDLLKTMSQTALSKISPLSQPLISNLSNHVVKCRIGQDKCKQFADWYKSFRNKGDYLFLDNVHQLPHDSRLRFHTTKELPFMRHWYKSAPTPTNDELQIFLDELNRGPVRQERPKVTLNHLRMWWRNERQRMRKINGIEIRKRRRAADGQKPAKNSSAQQNIHKSPSRNSFHFSSPSQVPRRAPASHQSVHLNSQPIGPFVFGDETSSMPRSPQNRFGSNSLLDISDISDSFCQKSDNSHMILSHNDHRRPHVHVIRGPKDGQNYRSLN